MKYITLLSVLFIVSCAKFKLPDDIPPAAVINIPDPTNTDSTLKDMPFKWGAALNVNLMRSNASYRHLAAAEMSSITAENAMKFRFLQPTQGNFTWTDADYLVSQAQANGQRVHGHTLIWHNSLPDWLTTYTGDSATLENIMKTHIQTVVTHFRGKVASWDVVNEAFEDNGVLRTSIWRTKLGDDYIARAFQYAYAADPTAILFYNDYGHEYSATKRTAIVNLLNNLRTRGVPVHGIGMQMHTRYNQPTTNIQAAISAAVSTGLQVHISELDIAVNPDGNQSLQYTTTLQEQQAAQYRFIVNTYYHTVPTARQFGITTWNLTDADSWIPTTYTRPDWPLLFNSSYQPKLTYYAVLAAVR